MQTNQSLPNQQAIPPFKAKPACGRSNWTNDERTAFFVKTYADTTSFTSSQIAEKLTKEFGDNFTRNSVIGRAHRVKVFVNGVWKKLCEAYPRPSATRVARKQDKPFTQPRNRVRADKPATNAIYAPLPKPPRSHLTIPVLAAAPDNIIKTLSLTETTCRWPIGDPLEADFHFCGRRKSFGIPYCEHHAAIAYNPAARRARRAA